MTSGRPLTEREKLYIMVNKDDKFPGQIANDLSLSRAAVVKFIKANEDTSSPS